MSRPGLVGREVATRKWQRDLVCFGWAETTSRHGYDVATWVAVWEVATWIFGVTTWKAHYGQKRCRDMNLMSRNRVAYNWVATWFWCRDLDRPGWCRDPVWRSYLEWTERCRDTNLMSRHGLAFQEVATWKRCRNLAWDWAREGGRDMRPRPGRYALPAHFERATFVACARDMRMTSLLCAQQRPRHGHCARPGFWVCALCTQPSFVTVHCLGSLFGHCSWTLFMNTVHRVKKNIQKF